MRITRGARKRGGAAARRARTLLKLGEEVADDPWQRRVQLLAVVGVQLLDAHLVQRQLRAQLREQGMPDFREFVPFSLSLPRELALPSADISLGELLLDEGMGALVVRGDWRGSTP